MDIFDQAIQRANSYALQAIQKEGYSSLETPIGSLFHKARQEGLPNRAMIITVHVKPDIGTEYHFRRLDSMELADLLDRGFEVYCYHYYLDQNLQIDHLEKKPVEYAGDIVQFWEDNDVAYIADEA